MSFVTEGEEETTRFVFFVALLVGFLSLTDISRSHLLYIAFI